MQTKIIFYKDTVAVNCLARDLENAVDVLEALEGHACIGLLSSNFPSTKEAIKETERWLEKLPCVSVGLGAGNPKYCMDAAVIAGATNPGHVNQTFPFAGYAAGYLKASGADKTLVNALISPTGTVGKVKISTGLVSSQKKDAVIDVESAIALLIDMGADSAKFFNMQGLKHIDEFKKVAEVCAGMGMELIEPTGGITEENLVKITEIALKAGVKRCMPHIYTSIIHKDSGLTNLTSVRNIYSGLVKLIG